MILCNCFFFCCIILFLSFFLIMFKKLKINHVVFPVIIHHKMKYTFRKLLPRHGFYKHIMLWIKCFYQRMNIIFKIWFI